MADRYWRGGTGTWNTSTTTNWSTSSGGAGGASVPTVADNVIFDQAATYNVTMTGALNCLSITVSAGVVSFLTGTSPTLQVRASMSLVAATIWSSTGTITFSSTTTGQTITTNNVSMNCSITLNGVGGGWSLGSLFRTGLTSITTLTNGELALNGFDLTTGRFSSNNANTRSIAFGANNIVLINNVASTVVLDMATITNFSYTGSGGFTNNAITSTRVFTCGTTAGATSTNAPNFSLTSGASQPAFTTNSWFNKLDYGTTSNSQTSALTLNVNSIILSTNATYTGLVLNLRGSGTLTYNGKTTGAVTLLDGNPTFVGTVACSTFTVNGPAFNFTSGTLNPTTSFVLTSGSFTLNGGTLGAVPTFTHTAGSVTFNSAYSLTATGTYTLTAGTLTLDATLTTGIFSSINTNVRSIVFGANNIVLAHTTAGQIVINMSNLTNLTWSGTGGFTSVMSVTRTFTCGSAGGGTINTAPNLTLTSGSSIASLTTNSWFRTLDFGTTSYTSGIFTINVMSLIANNSTSNIAALIINAVGGGVLYTNSTGIGALSIITGVTALQSGVTTNCTTCSISTGTLVITSGTTLTCSSSCTLSGTDKLQNNGTLTCTTFTVAGATYNMTSGTITPSTSFTITSGAFNYFSGTITSLPVFTQTAGNVTFYSNFSLIVTGTYTLTAGVLTLADNVTLTTGIFNSTGTTARSVVFGTRTAGNIHLTHTTAGTTVLGLSTSTTSLTWTGVGGFTVADMSNTRTFTMANNSYFPLTFTTGASVATLTSSFYAKSIDFGTTTFTLPATTVIIRGGTLTLGDGNYSALTLTFTTLTSSPGLDRVDFYPNNKSILALTTSTVSNTEIWFNGPVTMTGALTNSLFNDSFLYVLYDLTCGTFVKSNGAVSGAMVGSNIIWTITGATFTNTGPSPYFGSYTGMTISMTSASVKTFAGGGGLYPTLNNGGAGNLAITGSNFFDNITNSVSPCTFTFPPSTVQTVNNFNVNGNAGNLVSLTISTGIINSPSISKSEGTVSINYVNLNRLTATGGATWYAGANSTYVSSPTAGWIFTNPPTVVYTVAMGNLTITDGGFTISNDPV